MKTPTQLAGMAMVAVPGFVLLTLGMGCPGSEHSSSPKAALPEVAITMAESGSGQNVLVLHGGSGPVPMQGLVAHLAEHQHVLLPTHPGFNGTPRPKDIDTVAALAGVYLRYLEEHDIEDVLVVGSSMGGWLGVEMVLQDTEHRLSGLVLIDGVGVNIPGHPITNITGFTPPQIAKVACHDPAKCLPPGPAPTPEQLATTRANQATLAVYAGDPYCYDPKLLERLHGIDLPALLIWGDSDGVVTPEYGRAYADAIPDAKFEIVARAGHLPWRENPADTFRLLDGFVTAR